MPAGRIRAWARGRRSRPISTICRNAWQHESATGAVASLRSGYSRPVRGHDTGKTSISTGSGSTYRSRNTVVRNRATSIFWFSYHAMIQLKASHTLAAEALRCRRRGKVGYSWCSDEIYIKVKGYWHYLYGAINRSELAGEHHLRNSPPGRSRRSLVNVGVSHGW